jgi:uncharacterized protein YidB (DUF937 family)
MLKELLRNLLGGGTPTPHSGLLESGIKVLLDPKGPTGGLSGLQKMFNDRGLGHILESWIGTGPNRRISAGQVKKGLGPDLLQQIAGAVGLSKGAASKQLANYLPNIINKLTPQGQIPQGGDLAEKGLELLKNLL